MTTLGNGIATITPDFIDEYESTSEHGNIVHRILGSESVDVVLRPASLRSGRMSLGITDDTDATDAETALRTASVWTFNTARSSLNMSCVVQGTVTRQLDATRTVWLLGFGWQEVAT